MIFIDELSEKQLHTLINYIGNGVRPNRPFQGPGSVNKNVSLRCYAWNKLTSMDQELSKNTQEIYTTIARNIFLEMAPDAQELDLTSIVC